MPQSGAQSIVQSGAWVSDGYSLEYARARHWSSQWGHRRYSLNWLKGVYTGIV